MKRRILGAVMLAGMISGGAAYAADKVFINGNIYTVDNEFSRASAIAVEDGRIVYVGDNKGAKSYIKKGTDVIDLEGNTVIPGIVESHMHFTGEGRKLLNVDAFLKTKQEILEAVAAEAKNVDDGEWILGRGWNQEVWESPEFPTKEELDAVAPNNPVVLTRVCGHAIWVNSAALKVSGVDEGVADPQGGEFLRDKEGKLTGIITETARKAVRDHIPPYSPERDREAILRAEKQLLSYGITSASDMGMGINEIDNLKYLYENGALNIRVYALVSPGDSAEKYFEMGPQYDLYDNKLNISSFKLFVDGSLGSRSAWMLEEYSDRPGHYGNQVYTDEEFYSLVKRAREHDFQVATHAIGDAGNRQVIDTYTRVLSENPHDDHRYRIEHFQVVHPEDIKRAVENGIIPGMQAVHATSDMNMAEDRVGSERIKGAYAWRTVLDQGGIIANGSDAPVELVNPFYGLYASVARADLNGNPENGWYADESMTREEALKSFTIWAAYAQKEDHIKGSIEEGKLADFAVLDRDIMEVEDDIDITHTEVLMTVLDGRIIYSPES